MKIKGIISYDGSAYNGFQVQTKQNVITVQGTIEKVLSTIFNMPIHIHGSGRTDKGVHALNQVFHFEIPQETYDLGKLLYSLNKMLPDTIFVKELIEVDETFHARKSARKKHYQYRIRLNQDPFVIKYMLIYLKPLDIELIKKGMEEFLGVHHFYNFCSNNEVDDDYQKEIYSFTLTQKDNDLIFDIIGTGFKRYMVRMIMGTLLALGDHQIDIDYIKDKLSSPLGNNTSYNAEPQGLYLVEVIYD